MIDIPTVSLISSLVLFYQIIPTTRLSPCKFSIGACEWGARLPCVVGCFDPTGNCWFKSCIYIPRLSHLSKMLIGLIQSAFLVNISLAKIICCHLFAGGSKYCPRDFWLPCNLDARVFAFVPLQYEKIDLGRKWRWVRLLHLGALWYLFLGIMSS